MIIEDFQIFEDSSLTFENHVKYIFLIKGKFDNERYAGEIKYVFFGKRNKQTSIQPLKSFCRDLTKEEYVTYRLLGYLDESY